MKERLGVILVREGLVTPEQRDQALESQILSGGRLGTNLVDMKLLTVDQVGHYLSVQHGLPVASYEDLVAVPDEVAQRVPKAHCARYKVFPLGIDDKVLRLAMLDPDDLVALDELTFLLGLRIQPYVAPQLRLLQVLEKRHGFMRERRFLRIPDEEDTGGGAVAEARAPRARIGARISTLMPAITVPKLKPGASPGHEPEHPPLRPTPTLPLGLAGAARVTSKPQRGGAAADAPKSATPAVEPQQEDPTDTELVMLDQVPRGPVPSAKPPGPEPDDGINVVVEEPDDEEVTEVMDAHPEAETAVVPVHEIRRGGRGDEETDVLKPEADSEGATLVVHDSLSLGTLKSAAAAMDRADDRDAIIDLLVHPFRYQPVLGVLFLIRGEMAVGLAASTADISREEVRGLVLPLATPSLLSEAFNRQQVMRGVSADDPLQQVIARYVRWNDPEESCVAPVRHGGRVINLLCVQTRAGSRFPDQITTELEQLCDKAATSYVRLIKRHKRPVSSQHSPVAGEQKPAEPGPPERPDLPDQRFFITGHVGQEGPADVWRAIDTRNQRVVVLSLLPKGWLRPDQLERLQRLVKVLGQLNHAHILQPLAAGSCNDGRSYIVTAFAGEHTLRKRLDQNPTPPHPEVGELLRQLAEALAAAHSRKVFHGDVRPENVLFPVRDKLQLKLGGFGMPRGIPAGLPRPETARYMAPEGLAGPGGSAAADVYSLAAMTYEMLGGKLPIEGESLLAPPELPPVLPGVPHAALHMLARGLSHSPNQRPSVEELARELFKVLRTSVG